MASMMEMSRRSRRRRATGKQAKQGWLGKLALGLIVAGVVGAAILYATVRGYLYSDAFRRFLSVKTSEAVSVDGEFTPFRWDGLAVDTDAFEAAGNGIITNLRVDGLHTEVSVGGLTRGVWEIRGSRIQRVEFSLDARVRSPAVSIKKPAPPPARESGWLPREVELQGIDVREVVVKAMLDAGPLSVSRLRVRVEPAEKKRAYRVELADGAIRLPLSWVPELHLSRARLRYQHGRVFLNNSSAGAWKDGRLELSGEWDLAAGRYAFEGAATGVRCEDVFNEDWAKRCAGEMCSDFTLDNHDAVPVARGRLTIQKGTLTALPVLDTLAAYADTRRFRVLVLSEAGTDWQWKDGEIFFSKLVLGSEGLARLEGNLFIRGRELDGTFRLGLAPGTLASIPGAETKVFLAGERGLVWAPLRITGTLDNPVEDLSDRLKTAAGQRMFEIIPETGEQVLKFTRSILGDSPTQAVDQGLKIIEQGSKAMHDVTGGLLDGFLGSEPTPTPPKETPKDPPKEPEKPKAVP